MSEAINFMKKATDSISAKIFGGLTFPATKQEIIDHVNSQDDLGNKSVMVESLKKNLTDGASYGNASEVLNKLR